MCFPRNAHLWVPGYIRSVIEARQRSTDRSTIHVIFTVADHFEPGRGRPGLAVERERIRMWTERYPELAVRFMDADGYHPQHTFFYPEEEYRAEHLDAIAEMCRAGFGEVEIHLHHDNDTSDNLHQSLTGFKHRLSRDHGLLSKNRSGEIGFGFIHGNWALDNSRPDGRWCGVNDEITVLRQAGCYADFTMPSAPDVTQTKTVNQIYYAVDDPKAPKSHNRGVRAAVRAEPPPDSLLMVQGPLGVDWRNRKWGVVPRLENGDIHAGNPPTLHRFANWVRLGISVAGRPDWIFVKLHTHGALERNAAVLLGPAMRAFHEAITGVFNDGTSYKLHYVTARQMVNVIRAAVAGHTGDPAAYRDFEFVPVTSS